MASTAKLDVPLTLSVETVGVDAIKQLRTDVAALGKEGADAVPEFAALGAEIDRLANQSALVGTMRELSTEVEQLAAAQSEAAAKSATLSSVFAELHGETASLGAIEKSLKADIVEAQRALFDKRQELAKLKNGTTDYKEEARSLNAVIIQSKDDLRNLIEGYTAAKVATSEAAAAEAVLAKELKQADAVTKAATTALADRNTALQASKVSLEGMGAATKDVATAEADLVASYTKVTAAIAESTATLNAKKQANAEMLEADRLLAIEQRGMAELFEKGRIALIAEETAIREAARAAQAYTDARQAEAAARKAAEDAWQTEAAAIVNGVEAKQKMLRETQLLVEAYQFLAKEDAEAKWQKEAFAIVEAAEATQKLAREARLLAEAEEFLANEATLAAAGLQKIESASKEAGDAIKRALSDVGVRSAADIRAEITKVQTAMELLKSSGTLVGAELDAAFAKGGSKIKALERDLREATNQMTLADKAARTFSGAMGQFTAANLASEAVMYLVQSVQNLGRAFYDTLIQSDQLRRGLTAIYGDTAVVAKQIDFLRSTASATGVSVSSLSGEFTKFTASMKLSNVPMEQSNALFKAVSAASGALGLSAEDTAGSLNALGQMAAKGVVSMEELRQQLGDRLPGVLGLSAQAMGITQAQLVKLVETGSLATRDFIVPLTKGLETVKGETDGLIPTINNLKNAFYGMAQDIGEAGGTATLVGVLKVLGGTLGTIALAASALFEGVMNVAKAIGIMAGAALTLTNPMDALNAMLAASRDRLAKQNEALNAAIDGTNKLGTSSAQTAVVLNTSSQSALKAAEAVGATGKANELAALAAKLNADNTLDLSSKHVQFSATAAQMIDKQGAVIEASGKYAKAAKVEGDTLVALAKIRGDNNAVAEASVNAANLEVNALQELAENQKAETDMLLVQKQALIDIAPTRDLTAYAIKGEVEALDKKITKSAAETKQSKEALDAAKAEQFQRQLNIETLKDNTASVSAYKEALAQAVIKLKEYEIAAINGKRSDDEVNAARKEVTRATVLYNDALSDSVKAIEARLIAERAAATVAQSALQIQKQHYQSLEDTARATGDYSTALYANIEQKKIDIAIINAKVEAMKAEANGSIAVAKATLAELDASGNLDPIKRAQLEASIKIAEAKINEAKALGQTTESLERQIQALRDGTSKLDGFGESTKNATSSQNEFAGATDNATSALEAQNSELERNIAAQEKANDLEQRAIDLENKRKGVDKNGFSTNKNGETISIAGSTRTSVLNFLKEAGVDDEAVARTLTDEFSDSQGNIPYLNNPGQIKYKGSTLSDALLNAAESYTFANDSLKTQMRSFAGSGTSAGTSSGSNTVNITIGGISTPVNVASQADAANLQSVLTQLANAQGRSI